MRSRLFSRKLLGGIVLLLFFLLYTACGIPFDPVYVEDDVLRISSGNNVTPITISLSFDQNKIVYAYNGFNVYYIISNSEEFAQSDKNKIDMKLCYNETKNNADLPLVNVTSIITQNTDDSDYDYNFELSFSKDTGYLYIKKNIDNTDDLNQKLSRFENTEPFLSSYFTSSDPDISFFKETDSTLDLNEPLHLHIYIEYFVSRDPSEPDLSDYSELKHVYTYEIE